MREYIYQVMTDKKSGRTVWLFERVLLVLSFFYGCVVALKNFFYGSGIFRPKNFGCRVVSVGNITWGGVGKTPFVVSIAQYLSAQNVKIAVLTRGYMKKRLSGFAQSDEAAMIREILPDAVVGVGANRLWTGRKILENQPVDVFILDDGFQHRKVARDLDIVLVDATNPFGNGALIPRGILREPLSSLKRADIIILTKSGFDQTAAQELENRIRSINATCATAWAVHTPEKVIDLFSGCQQSLECLRGRRVISFCGIGDPSSFAQNLRAAGAVVEKNLIFRDHHEYSLNDIHCLVAQAKELGVGDIVTTAKDAVKIKPFGDVFEGRRVLVLEITVDLVKGKHEVFERIDRLLGF